MTPLSREDILGLQRLWELLTFLIQKGFDAAETMSAATMETLKR
jgi:hypothetical protein